MIDSDRVNGSEWRFPYYESLGPSQGRNNAGIFDFVPGARSRDTELGLSGQKQVGDDRQSLAGLIFWVYLRYIQINNNELALSMILLASEFASLLLPKLLRCH